MSQIELFQTPPDVHEFTDPVKLKEFILAGKAKFTLQSTRTTKHFTFKVRAGSVGMWWVSRLSDEGYVYLGAIDSSGFRPTRKTLPRDIVSEQFKAFDWFWRAFGDHIPSTVRVYHEGKCGRCGLPLTDPLSIREGYGPECRKAKFARPAQEKRPAG